MECPNKVLISLGDKELTVVLFGFEIPHKIKIFWNIC